MSKNEKIKTIVKFTIIGIILVSLVAFTIYYFPKIMRLIDKDNQDNIVNKIREKGIIGWVIFLLIQISQIVISFIPGEPVEVIAGVLYGTLGGLLTCLLGCFIGTSLVYLLSLKLGRPFIKLFVKEKDIKEVKFFKDEKRVEELVFIFYFIPGTPKDILTYLGPYIRIKPLKFILISTFARIPSIITSTWAGSSISDNNWLLTIGVFGGTFLIALLGLLIRKKYFNNETTKHDEDL